MTQPQPEDSTQRGEYSDSALAKLAKGMFEAPEGFTFVARDFSGIEAVLVGKLAGSAKYTRLAKLGVHDYFMAHGILRPDGKISEADLPNLAWSDDDLRACFKALKARFKLERDVAKRCVHLSNYLGTPGKMNEEYPETFPTKKSAAIPQGTYFSLFPEITHWHKTTVLAVNGDKEANAEIVKLSYGCVHAGPGWIRTPSGFIHRFFKVLDWKKVAGQWEWSYGDDAKRLIATVPQHSAAWIGKLVLKRLYNNHTAFANEIRAIQHKAGLVPTPTWTPRKIDEWGLGGDIEHPWLRLFIHDEVFTEVPKANNLPARVDELLRVEMEAPIERLPIDPAWGMGPYLAIGSEGKQGDSWGSMK